MTSLARLLDDGRARGVFSEARAVVLRRGRVEFDGGPSDSGAVFDLASVTKVMCTTAIAGRLVASGRLDPSAPVRSFVPELRGDATTIDLALHRSGLPAFVPFFAEVARTRPSLFDRTASAGERSEVREEIVSRAFAVAPERQVGERAVYSDVGFIVLGEVLSRLGGAPLDVLFQREVAAPLGLGAAFRRISLHLPADHVVSTGGARPREPAPGQEGLWSCSSWPSEVGEVDDDNAWVMDGVAGHAGLFATALDVARFGEAVRTGWLQSPIGWAPDASTPGSTRTFGFDTPSSEAPSCGTRFGRAGPRGAIGHLGFTGTSLWLDFDRELVVALLTNRVFGGRANVMIRSFRPAFHDAVLDALGG